MPDVRKLNSKLVIPLVRKVVLTTSLFYKIVRVELLDFLDSSVIYKLCDYFLTMV